MLDAGGGVQALEIDSGTGSVIVRAPDPFAPPAERLIPVESDGYVLVQPGALLPLASAPLPPSSRWNPDEVIVDAKYDPAADGVWLLTEGGELYLQHELERVPFPLAIPDGRTWRRLDVDPLTGRFLVLDDAGDVYVVKDDVAVYDAHASGAVAASLIPGTSGVAVVREDGLLLYGDPAQEQLAPAGMITATPVVDMEILTDRRAFILDAYGRIRDEHDRPVAGAHGMQLPYVRDLSVAAFEDPPQWLPPGWKTRLTLEPTSIVVMPGSPPGERGPPAPDSLDGGERDSVEPEDGNVAVRVTGAEELCGWIAELHFDPRYIVISEEDVHSGPWWHDAVPGAQVSASVNPEQGVLWLQGGSAAQPGWGATGGGILSTIRLRPRDETHSNSRFNLIQASISHTAMPFLFRPLGEPLGVTVTVSARPRWLDLTWRAEGQPQDARLLHAGDGELIESAVVLEEGASLRRLEVTLAYNQDRMRPVVAYPGSAWRRQGKLDFQETERPGGRLRATIRAIDGGASRMSGEVLVVVWRTRGAPTGDEARTVGSIERARAFSSTSARGTRLRIGAVPLELAIRQGGSSQ